MSSNRAGSSNNQHVDGKIAMSRSKENNTVCYHQVDDNNKSRRIMAEENTSPLQQVGSHNERHNTSQRQDQDILLASPSHGVRVLHRPSTMDNTFGIINRLDGISRKHDTSWQRKKPPSITSPSQNFGTAQKPLPRVEDSE